MNSFLRTACLTLCVFSTKIQGFGVDQTQVNRTNATNLNESIILGNGSKTDLNQSVSCSPFSPPDIDTATIFPSLNFNASWISNKYFWQSKDFDFESRYERHVSNVKRTKTIVKVFVLPHSHNDPGWLNTYEQYYYRQTKNILDSAVQKLSQHPYMTFVWSETTYLAKWWKRASSVAKNRLLELIEEGRLEIATGGWVVPDEATPSLYALINELTVGQQWVKDKLNVTAEYSWAIDPFGHSSTHSHLLKKSGIKGMVTQRLHYAWKHWLAEHKTEEFKWRPKFDSSGSSDIPCLTFPYDLYSIKHACGPEPEVCLKFDFRRIQFEYGENRGIMTPITTSNVRKLAEELVAQYHKTASLTNRKIILVPLGDDFRYDRPQEWDQQYSNYMRLFSYINSNRNTFGMEAKFGTIRDYYNAIEQELKDNDQTLPVLSGDFFPYADVYASGRPSYWTGYYGTRPYWKKFHRELENELRSAEILFTYANALADSFVEIKTLSYVYLDLVYAREEFAVFTHHDGITGSSRRWVMEDYGDKLFFAYLKSINAQIQSCKIIHKHVANKTLPPMMKDFLRENFEDLPRKVSLEVFENEQYSTNLMVFNNLAWPRSEMIKVLVKNSSVNVYDTKERSIPSQINPVIIHNERENTLEISERLYELVFIADLDPLAFSVFQIRQAHGDNRSIATRASVTCKTCLNFNEAQFPANENLEEPFKLENSENTLHFQSNGLLERIEMKGVNKSVPVSLSFGLYKPVNGQSAAYLLKISSLQPEWNFFKTDEFTHPHVIKIVGPIMSQIISVHYTPQETIKVNTTILNSEDPLHDPLFAKGIMIENYVDFTREYSNKVEVFMRFDTGLESSYVNGKVNRTGQSDPDENAVPIMYTDQNGLVNEQRIYSKSVGYEGNIYPVTTMAHIQDEAEGLRFSVLVDRSHGFSTNKSGRLETLIERKSIYDDARGLSEGVTDVKPTVSKYVILLEEIGNEPENESVPQGSHRDQGTFSSWQPTLTSHKTSLRLNYPPSLYVYNEPAEEAKQEGITKVTLISTALPDDVHLLNFQTMSEKTNGSYEDDDIAGNEALLNLQYLYEYKPEEKCLTIDTSQTNETAEVLFNPRYLNVSKIVPTTLTGSIDEHDSANNTSELETRRKPTTLLSSFKYSFLLV